MVATPSMGQTSSTRASGLFGGLRWIVAEIVWLLAPHSRKELLESIGDVARPLFGTSPCSDLRHFIARLKGQTALR